MFMGDRTKSKDEEKKEYERAVLPSMSSIHMDIGIKADCLRKCNGQ